MLQPKYHKLYNDKITRVAEQNPNHHSLHFHRQNRSLLSEAIALSIMIWSSFNRFEQPTRRERSSSLARPEARDIYRFIADDCVQRAL